MPAPASARPARRAAPPLRILTAVPLCDGHDSAITTINLELARNGIEVIYLGYHQAASSIARAAVQEDVHAIGLSSYNGGHVVFFREVLAQLRARGAEDIPVFGGGGGTITPADVRALQRAGVHRIFPAGTSLDAIVAAIQRDYHRGLPARVEGDADRRLARALTRLETRAASDPKPRPATRRPGRGFVLGVAGPGGAGKSTLIDELTSRFLRAFPARRLAILANDPSHPDSGGAVLGDRVSAIYAQDDRVFFRSLATRGHLSGVSATAASAIRTLQAGERFDLILVESVGVGQESDPFQLFGNGPSLVDAVVFVMSPHYGGRIQLQKIALLNGADLVALNKCDDPRATSARTELASRLAATHKNPPLHTTIATRHEDPGVDRLFEAIVHRAGLEPPGGEAACQLAFHAPELGTEMANSPERTTRLRSPSSRLLRPHRPRSRRRS